MSDERPANRPFESEKIKFDAGKKFDIQLGQAVINEHKLGDIFLSGKIELKTESWLWEKTGNICIEFRSRGELSGIAVTEAEYWMHELKRDDETLMYLMFPVERLKHLCRIAYRAGRWRSGAGDDGAQDVILLRLRDLLA